MPERAHNWLICALVLGGAACLATVLLGCAFMGTPQVRLRLEHGSCGGVLVAPGVALTAGHCADSTPAHLVVATCEGESASVASWQQHPQYTGSSPFDLALAKLDHELACYEPITTAPAALGDEVWWRGLLGLVEQVDELGLVINVSPRMFCPSSSGEPILNNSGQVVGIVSRWWAEGTDERGCSCRVRAVELERSGEWLHGAALLVGVP